VRDEEFLNWLVSRVTAHEVWVAVAYVIGMFTAVVFRPRQIGNAKLFRVSYLLFGLYMLIPAAVESFKYLMSLYDGLFQNIQPGVIGMPRGQQQGLWLPLILPLFSSGARVLLPISIVCGLASFRIGAGALPPRTSASES
jgi:hypothetical protein